MSNEEVTKVMRKLAECYTERAQLAGSADFCRTDRIEVETGDGAVIFRSPVHFKLVAVYDSPYGLRMYADVALEDLPFLLPGKAYVLIDRPEEGKAYHTPGLKSAERAGTHVLSNTASNRALYCEVTESLIEVYILRDRVVIDIYNADAVQLTFRQIMGSLGAIADYDHVIPGDVIVKLTGSHTEVESEELAELLLQYAPLYSLDVNEGKCYGWLAFQRDGEDGTFLACDL